jgi:glyoxylase-like metal-dependent hydrolase (beta-lactamase superfamily II)
MPPDRQLQFSPQSPGDGEEFQVENLRFKLLETPGHTPDCAVYVVTDLERGEEPVLAFTGDTLLVGDVGRPDLFPSKEEELAEKLFDSLAALEGAAGPCGSVPGPRHGLPVRQGPVGQAVEHHGPGEAVQLCPAAHQPGGIQKRPADGYACGPGPLRPLL